MANTTRDRLLNTPEVWDTAGMDYSGAIRRIVDHVGERKLLRILVPAIGKGRFVRELLLDEALASTTIHLVAVEADPDKTPDFRAWLLQHGWMNDDEASTTKEIFLKKEASTVRIIHDYFERYLTNQTKGTFNIILCLLYFHYSPQYFISILRTLYGRLNSDGIFVFDELTGEAPEDEALLRLMDSHTDLITRLSQPEDETEQHADWKSFYLWRLREEQAYWASAIKATRAHPVVSAMEPLFQKCPVEETKCFSPMFSEEHLPWTWARWKSDAAEAGHDDLEALRKKKIRGLIHGLSLRVKFRIYICCNKLEDRKLDAHWRSVVERSHLEAVGQLNSVLWFIGKSGVPYAEAVKRTHSIIPAVIMQLIASSGLFNHENCITSAFLATGTLPRGLRLTKLRGLRILVNPLGDAGTARRYVDSWAANYYVYSSILKQTISERFIDSGLPVAICAEQNLETAELLRRAGFHVLPVPRRGIPDLSNATINAPTQVLLSSNLISIDRFESDHQVDIDPPTREALEQWTARLTDAADPSGESHAGESQALQPHPQEMAPERLALNLLLENLGTIVFVPMPSYFDVDHDGERYRARSILGMGLTLREVNPRVLKEVDDIIKVSRDLIQHFHTNYLSLKWVDEARASATRSAVATIMSRNMSHNIGSHVLARLSSSDGFNKILNGEQRPEQRLATLLAHVSELNAYLRTRMDFIADVATGTPTARIAMRLHRDVLSHLYHHRQETGDQRQEHDAERSSQVLLLNYISGIEDINIRNLEIEFESPEDSDPVIAWSNGVLGEHALFTIIENVIRNSAKHAYNEKGTHRKLSLSVQANRLPNFPDLVEIRIHDNIPLNDPARLIREMNERIRQPILEDDGGIHPLYWGMKEMKICAAYLRGVPHEEIDQPVYNPAGERGKRRDDSVPPLLEAVGHENGAAAPCLAYRFYLPLPKHAFILDSDGALGTEATPDRVKDLERHGIDFDASGSVSDVTVVPHDFLVVAGNAGQTSGSGHQNNLPLRVLHLGDSPELANMARTLLRSGKTGGSEFVNDLWLQWIRHRYDGLSLAFLFEKFSQTAADRWQKLADDGFPLHVRAIGSKLLNLRNGFGAADRLVVYERHGWQLQHGPVMLKEVGREGSPRYLYGTHFYDPHGNRHVISQALDNPPPNIEQRRRLALELLEAGACGIILLDERLQELASSMSRFETYGSRRFMLRDLLRYNRIFIPDRPENEEEPTGSMRVNLDHPREWESNLKEWLGQFNAAWREEAADGTTEVIGHNVSFLVVHLGVLEKMFPSEGGPGKQKAKIKAQIDDWESKGMTVIVTSGRGSPPVVKEIGCRFLHYSQIARHVLEFRSKFNLCKALFAARRQI